MILFAVNVLIHHMEHAHRALSTIIFNKEHVLIKIFLAIPVMI